MQSTLIFFSHYMLSFLSDRLYIFSDEQSKYYQIMMRTFEKGYSEILNRMLDCCLNNPDRIVNGDMSTSDNPL